MGFNSGLKGLKLAILSLCMRVSRNEPEQKMEAINGNGRMLRRHFSIHVWRKKKNSAHHHSNN